MRVKVVNGNLVVVEDQGGSRGTNYFYLNVNEKLEHIGRLFKGQKIREGKGGRRKTYEYVVSLDSLRNMFGTKIELYEFSFSNSGHGPYCRIYEVDCVTGAINEKGVSTHLDFKIIGLEEDWLNWYDRIVPRMIKRIKDIQQALGIELFFAEKSVRLEDIYNDPANAKRIALIFPQPQARSRALQGYIQASHELYVLMLVAEALGGKTIYHVYGKPTWWIAHAQDDPTAVIESNGRKFTVWYQFAIKEWIDVVFSGLVRAFLDPKELERLAMEGKFDELEKILGKKPNNVAEAYSMITNFNKLIKGRQHVKPDIVIFEGDYRSKGDLKRNPPNNIVLIDAKIRISDNDIKQLKEYKDVFDREFEKGKMHYVIACLEKAEHKLILEKLGFIVVENVAPDKEGEKKFVEVIKDLL